MKNFTATRIVTLAATLALLAGGAQAGSRRPKSPHCAGGYYAIDGEPLVPGAAGTDTLAIGNGQVSTASGCAASKAAVFRTKPGKTATGDVLLARWASCGSLRKVVLKAQIAADCSTVSGTFKAKGSKKRSFTAHDALPSNLRDVSDALPEGAEIVSPDEFIAASGKAGFRVVSPRVFGDDEAAAAAADKANQETLDAFVKQHPELASFASIGVDPNDPDLTPTEDGNYALNVYDADGNGSTIVTMGPRYQRAVRADTIRTYPTQVNQLAIYTERFAIASTINPNLPSPADVADWTAEDLAGLNQSVAMQEPAAESSQTLPGEEVPASYPGRCGLEIGAGDGTDGSGYCKHTGDGLWNNATWPLKFYDTCVKSQAARGSCVAFAVTAGREMRVAQKYDRWVNLSEQHLYYTAKEMLQPVRYGDGLDGSLLLQQLRDTNYQQPMESQWDYNPSNSRTSDDKTGTYMNSCTNYGGDESAFCSDTAGQARFICMQAGPAFVCAVLGAPAGGITVRSIEQPSELWDAGNRDDSLVNVLYAAAVLRTPVVLGFDVVSSFDSPDKNGYVTFNANKAKVCATDATTNKCKPADDCECSRGGHAALAVGYINNSKLPEAAPKGAGGGYVIIKNSWGCAADGGYYYVPMDWAKAFFYSARPVGDVETSATLPEQPFDDYHFDFHPAPPSIRIVQPLLSDHYVAGQGVPLSLSGADYQYPDYALLGPIVWTSNLQGQLASTAYATTTLIQGTHQITVTYTGKTGATATARTTVVVGPKPLDIPPTPYFVDLVVLPAAQCPQSCSFNCVIGYGHGVDPEDGVLTSASQVSWYAKYPNDTQRLVASGADTAAGGKFLGCARLCGGTFNFTLDVKDSAGQHAESRREIATGACIN